MKAQSLKVIVRLLSSAPEKRYYKKTKVILVVAMDRLIKLAGSIKDEDLRKKVIEFIKDPKLSHKEFKKYPSMKIEEARTVFSAQGSPVERDVLMHTISLVELCMRAADVVEKNYEIPINKDHLVAAAILHDFTHLFEYKRDKAGEIEHTGVMLDHSMLAVAEFYHRGFPENVIHIIAAHFGESGPTPPRNFEALIMHHLDTMLAMVEFHMYGSRAKQPMQLVMFDDETLKQITGKVVGDKSKRV
jgi:7,8-dihydroneopterin 2',3'-cyclic phosphate phosphodiesterase